MERKKEGNTAFIVRILWCTLWDSFNFCKQENIIKCDLINRCSEEPR